LDVSFSLSATRFAVPKNAPHCCMGLMVSVVVRSDLWGDQTVAFCYRLTTAGQSSDRDIGVLLYIAIFMKNGMSFAGRINQDDHFFLKKRSPHKLNRPAEAL
jgi:hypothetical protein